MSQRISRSTNFELLRIVSMLLILFNHLNVCSDFYNLSAFNELWCVITNWGGQVGVSCFVLVSGYFMCKRTIKKRKLFETWTVTFFYSASILVIFVMTGAVNLTPKLIVQSVFPIIFNQYWFITAYFGLLIISPLLNIVVTELTNRGKKEYLKWLAIMMLLFSVLPTVTNQELYGSSFAWFCCLYLFAAYIRQYGVNIGRIVLVTVSFVTVCAVCGSVYVIEYIGKDSTYFIRPCYRVSIAVISMCVFLIFQKTNLKYNRIILWFSESTLAVYLIHAHRLMYKYLWNDILCIPKWGESPLFPLVSVVSVAGVFCVCTLIEKVRKAFFSHIEITSIIRKSWR